MWLRTILWAKALLLHVAEPHALNKRSPNLAGQTRYIPCTVVTVNGNLSGQSLGATIDQYRGIGDDVWSEAQFLERILVQSASNVSAALEINSLSSFLSENAVEYLFLSPVFNATRLATSASVHSIASTCDLTNGPHVVTLSPGQSDLSVTTVFGIHEDVFEAFMSGSIPSASIENAHLTMQVSVPGTRMPGIIVPLRIASAITTNDPGPLAGLRFAVKDIFHVSGLKTSGGSRAYYQVYGPQNYTTQTVDKSLAGGAQLVGKTRTIAFALGAPNNGKEIDYLDPWNPRGDGYQTTGGSSSGSGSAVTAYDWLDFTIGSDTGGSPTHGIFNLTGILVAIAEQDTPGFLTRSPSIFTRLGKWWAKGTPLEAAAETPLPSKLLFYADELALTQSEAEAMKVQFLANVSAALNMSTSSINERKRGTPMALPTANLCQPTWQMFTQIRTQSSSTSG
ncbi:amidase signature domain-containing protein [Dendryphion nanum]|uniref:Amidase signature domain-containing protein n=1 Tax=Dendryphion nanum TaxID=256645 RepID=A0A9P9IQW0_9PLEO|nr:amidase signature domain-containing protein [Dendryphion nanum]